MKTYLIKIWLGLAVAGIVAVAAQARAEDPSEGWMRTVGQYAIKIPATSLDCAKEAELLGAKFSALPLVTVKSTRCLATEQLPADGAMFKLYSLQVNYEYDISKAPSVYSAILGEGDLFGIPNRTHGAYASYGECLGDLETQKALFSQATKLAPMSATCLPAYYVGHGQSQTYYLQVDGIGDAALKLIAFAPNYVRDPGAAFTAQVESMIRGMNGVIVRKNGDQILYYSKVPAIARHQSMMIFDHLDQCHANENEMRSIFKGAGATSVLLQCFSLRDDSPQSPVVMETVRDGSQSIGSDDGSRSPRYYTLEDCQNDRARQIEELKQHYSNILGSVCHKDRMSSSDQYVLDVFQAY